MEDTDRLRMLRALNPEFAEAEARGEKWARHHAEMVRGVDGKAGRQHPERTPHEDGQSRNWCGSCLHPEGCVSCDLSEMPHNLRKEFGSYKTK
jgi:hypothetical protein